MEQTQRRIRSFVMRAGRMTEGQRRGWDQGWRRFGLDPAAGTLDWQQTFGTNGKRIVEIGFGMGDSLYTMAQARPDECFVGIEVHRPGVGRLLSRVVDDGLTNLRVYAEDAVQVLNDCIAPSSLDGLQVFFPDPWHKKRHHKRRLIQPEFVVMAGQKLAAGGVFHLATDWQPYAEHMMAVMSAAQGLQNIAGEGCYSPRPDWRPETKFERRGARLGHGVWDLLFRKC